MSDRQGEIAELIERARENKGKPQPSSKHSLTGYLFAFLFGGAFVISGMFIVMVATNIIPTDDSKIHVPRAMLAVIGLAFAIPGFFFWGAMVHAYFSDKHRKQMLAENPDRPWLADRKWDETGHWTTGWGEFVQVCVVTLVMTAIVMPLFYFAWEERETGLIVAAVVFGLFWLLVLMAVPHSLWKTLKYGKSGVTYERFPFFTGELVEMTWSCPRGLGDFQNISFVLKCVKQVTETTTERHDGRTRTVTRTSERKVWSDKFEIDEPGEHSGETQVPLTFQVPADAKETDSFLDEPISWELEVKAKAKGPDFSATYDLPVYRRPG